MAASDTAGFAAVLAVANHDDALTPPGSPDRTRQARIGPTTWPACHLTALPAASKVARAGATRRRPRSQRSDAASQRELAIVSVQPRKGESRCALRTGDTVVS